MILTLVIGVFGFIGYKIICDNFAKPNIQKIIKSSARSLLKEDANSLFSKEIKTLRKTLLERQKEMSTEVTNFTKGQKEKLEIITKEFNDKLIEVTNTLTLMKNTVDAESKISLIKANGLYSDYLDLYNMIYKFRKDDLKYIQAIIAEANEYIKRFIGPTPPVQSRPLYTPDTFTWLNMYNKLYLGDKNGKSYLFTRA